MLYTGRGLPRRANAAKAIAGEPLLTPHRMPCRWHEKTIVVLDSVMIAEPYALTDVKGNDQNAVKRVKKVVRLQFSSTPLLHP